MCVFLLGLCLTPGVETVINHFQLSYTIKLVWMIESLVACYVYPHRECTHLIKQFVKYFGVWDGCIFLAIFYELTIPYFGTNHQLDFMLFRKLYFTISQTKVPKITSQ